MVYTWTKIIQHVSQIGLIVTVLGAELIQTCFRKLTQKIEILFFQWETSEKIGQITSLFNGNVKKLSN